MEVLSAGPAGLGQTMSAAMVLDCPSPSRRGTGIPTPERSALEEERVEPPKGGTLEYEGPGREKPRNEKPQPGESGIEKPWHHKSCERPV